MSPILKGVVASSKAQSSGGGTSFESIATVAATSGGTATLSFTSIPGTYKHLQIRGITRQSLVTAGADWSNLVLIFNSDTGANYDSHVIRYRSDNNSFSSSGTSAQSVGYQQVLAPTNWSGYANLFSGYEIDIFDYANTSKAKAVRGLGGYSNGTSGWGGVGSTLWESTSTITRIDIQLDSVNHVQYSQFALYGIKG